MYPLKVPNYNVIWGGCAMWRGVVDSRVRVSHWRGFGPSGLRAEEPIPNLKCKEYNGSVREITVK